MTATKVNVKAIAFISYPVSNIVRARKFYEDVLGFVVENNYGNEFIEYDIPGQTFTIDAASQDF